MVELYERAYINTMRLRLPAHTSADPAISLESVKRDLSNLAGKIPWMATVEIGDHLVRIRPGECFNKFPDRL